MRNELEQIQKIELLLKGQLPEQERIAFEQEIAGNPQLQEDLELQQAINNGLERISFRRQINKAAFRFKWLRWLYRGAVTALILTTAVFSLTFLLHDKSVYNGHKLPEYNESGQKRWERADSIITPQIFSVNASKDTVIETKGGIVLSIPAGCFLNKSGQSANGNIQFVVKEALDAATIIRSGLSTMAGNKLLESGGMFFIDARKNGEALRIDPKNSIYAQIPSDSVKAGMQIFHGERLANGNINWIAPKSIEHFLVPVDIKTLNFYPPRYLDLLASWGFDVTNKKLTDSLYYSLASLFEVPPQSVMATVDTAKGKKDTVQQDFWFDGCAINPAKIKAIWNDKFQNTILATKEFEERLHRIHSDYGSPELELYVNNLDKPLYVIDSMVAAKNTGTQRNWFLDFAARRDGKVDITSKQLKRLKEYYRIKSKIFTDAAVKTQGEFLKKQASLDEKANKSYERHNADSTRQANQNYQEEFDLNLKNACRQLGYSETNLGALPQNTYNVKVTLTGWCNIDRYVDESVSTRTTLNFTDKETGKKAIIKYIPVSFRINKPADYDNILLYLLPDKLNSFIKVDGSSGIYAEKLNELIKYNLLCIAYKNEHAFIYSENNIEQKNHQPIELKQVSDQQITAAINRATDKKRAVRMVNENIYQIEEFREQQKAKNTIESQVLKVLLIKLLFNCNPVLPALGRPASAQPAKAILK